MIKACFLIKYPPIQGGVSRHGYWLSRDLAERGHHVYVVTNANEVEDEYRIHLDEEDREWYEPKFDETGGFVRVRNTQPPNKDLVHIPFTNPYVTKLASIATQVIRRHGCEVIFAYYLQPYGLAAYLASQWTGVPYMVRHAGSDLGRLMKQRDLTTAYREVLKAADCVWSGLSDVNPFLAMEVREENIWRGRPALVPNIFDPQAEPLDFNELLRKLERVQTTHVQNVLTNRSPIDPTKPTIGIYGKAGEVKGSFDLLRALGNLKREGLDFNFVALTQGREFDGFREAIRENDMQDRTWTFPFIPHWKVPGFIRACTAVCFLERDFPISFHGPGIPKEVLACGTCLLVSGEIADKQRAFRDRYVDGENVLLVADPKQHPLLEEKLRFVIENPERAREIGLAGRGLLNGRERAATLPHKPKAPVEGLAERLAEIIERRKAGGGAADAAVGTAPADRKAILKGRLPYTSSLLNGNWEQLLELFCSTAPATPDGRFNDAVRLCEFIETRLASLNDPSPYLADVLRYEKNCNLLYADARDTVKGRPQSNSPFDAGNERARQNSSVGRLLSLRRQRDGGLLNLKPVKVRGVTVESFDYDVRRVLSRLADGEPPGEPSREPSFILFKKDINFIGLQLELNAEVKRLLDRCDGTRTVENIVAELARREGDSNGVGREEQLRAEVIATLQDLTAKGVVRWLDGMAAPTPPAASRPAAD